MVKYVDDVCLVSSIRKSNFSQDIENLKKEIKHITDWSNTNGMTLNISKTTGLVKYRGTFKETCNVNDLIYGVVFQPDVRFLGIILDDTLKWKRHVNYIAKKSSQRMYILRRMKTVASVVECKQIYYALIRSLLEYACPAFVGLSNSDSKAIKKIQNRCMRIIGVEKSLVEDLDDRRKKLARNIFETMRNHETFISDFVPPLLPSGRSSVIHCNTNLRRNSFFPYLCNLISGVHCD